MKIKSFIIMLVGATVLVISATGVLAEEINRINDVPVEEFPVEEQDTEEPILIAPSPYGELTEDELTDEDEVIPLLDRGEPDTSEVTEEDGSEIYLISEADSKNSDVIKNSYTPVILILGTVGLLVILLLVINRKK